MKITGPKKRVAAKLRDPITFQRRVDKTDDYGNVRGELEDLFDDWADIRETTGKEQVASGVVESTRTATIRVRYSAAAAGVTAADCILARGQIWNIRSGPVQVGHAPILAEFLCETGVAV